MTTREEALAYGLSFDNVYDKNRFTIPTGSLSGFVEVKKHFSGSMSATALSI